jgi:CubicO group peptidase (beta-lactamase class C family)
MRSFRIALVALFVSALSGAAQGQATIGGDWRADVRRHAERMIEAGLSPGFGIAVVQGDWVVFDEGFGTADAATGAPVHTGTHFYIASSTKALTATAVLALAERGKIDLDAPVTRYLPALALKQPLDAGDIRIRDLLAMTEGIGEGVPVVFRTAYSGEFATDRLVGLLADYGSDDNGQAFDYSNLPYNVLGLVIDAVVHGDHSAGGWKSVVREKVLEPLGMRGTTAFRSRLAPDAVAMPHELGPDGGFRRIRLAKDDANLHAAGGHFSTAGSLARFVAAHVAGGVVDGRRVFPASLIALSHERHAEQERAFGPFDRDGWGYGWDLARWKGRRMLQRFGAFAGYWSHMSFMPEHEIGVVVLSNGVAPVPAADAMALYVYDRLLGRDDLEKVHGEHVDWMASRYREIGAEYAEARAGRAARLAPLPRDLEAYAGTYENESLGRMTWRVVAGGLEVRAGVARSRAEVFDADAHLLRVTLTGGGTVVGFRFEDGDSAPASGLVWRDFEFECVEPTP